MTTCTRQWVSAGLALLLASFAVPARARDLGCNDPKQVLIIEPLNPVGPLSDPSSSLPAITADGRDLKDAVFKFAVVAVTYNANGGAVAHGCDPAKGGCAGDIGSVLGSLKWETMLFPGSSIVPTNRLPGALLSPPPICVSAAQLVPGPFVSVNLRGPAGGPTEIPPLTFVQSALLAVPAGLLSPQQAAAAGAVKLTSWPVGSSSCTGSQSPIAYSMYNAATKMASYDRNLACTFSHSTPSLTLFVRDLAGVAE